MTSMLSTGAGPRSPVKNSPIFLIRIAISSVLLAAQTLTGGRHFSMRFSSIFASVVNKAAMMPTRISAE